jgi:hypothetical protein
MVRIAQTCFGLSGGFAPVILPLFQGIRFAVDVVRFSVSCMGRTPLLTRRRACSAASDVVFSGRDQRFRRLDAVNAGRPPLTQSGHICVHALLTGDSRS